MTQGNKSISFDYEDEEASKVLEEAIDQLVWSTTTHV